MRDLKGTDKLESVFGGQAWSMAELLFGLEALIDEDRRPLGERRAPSAAKSECAMLFAPCPYDDYRFGKSMNLDALVQIKGNLKPVLADIASFRAAVVSERSWTNMLVTVLDQLAGPALHYLRRRDVSEPLPVPRAVGYKLAAGFFDVTMRLLRKDMVTPVSPVSAERFLEIVDVEQALAGPAEVCGGPIRLIARATRVFLEGDPGAEPLDDPVRRGVVDILATQVGLGLSWRVYDEIVEREVLDLYTSGALVPKTTVVERGLNERVDHHRGMDDEPTLGAVIASLPAPGGELTNAVAASEPSRRVRLGWGAPLAELVAFGEGGLEPTGDDARARMIASCAAYLWALRGFLRTQVTLEQRLRAILGYPHGPGIVVAGLSLPLPRARRWFEAMLGHHLIYEASLEPTFAFRNHRRRVPLDAPV